MVTSSVARRPVAPEAIPEAPNSRAPDWANTGLNPLVDGDTYETLQNCRAVLAFVSEFHCRQPDSEPTQLQEAGLSLVLAVLDDAMQCAAEQVSARRAQ
jgi:hypothetical protein